MVSQLVANPTQSKSVLVHRPQASEMTALIESPADEDTFKGTRMDDETLVRQFRDQSLSYDHWTHRSHVRVGFAYLDEFETFEKALRAVRKDIKAYNKAQNTPETNTSGYHETITRAFLQLIDVTRVAFAEANPVADSNEFCDAHPQLMCRQVLRLFYSSSRIMTPEAKHSFVEPDLATLPRTPGT